MQGLARVLALGFLGSPALAQKAPPGTVVAGELGRRVDRVVAEAGVGYWGAVLVAVQGEVVYAKGHGMADRRKVELGPQCVFDLGAASQMLTRLLVLRLCGEGKLALDDRVGRFCKDWPADKAAITVQHLLEHRSGLPTQAPWGGGSAGSTRTAFATIAACVLRSAPGEAVHPSALNSVLLALVCEEATEKRFDKLLVDRALRPAGMARAGTIKSRFDTRLVTARRTEQSDVGEPATAADWNWAVRGAQGVLASVLDVHELLQRVVDGQLLDEAMRERWLTPLDAGQWFSVATNGHGGDSLWRVAGEVRGYRTCWVVHPTSRTWFVLCSDDRGGLGALEAGLIPRLAALAAVEQPAPERAAPAGAGGAGDPAAHTFDAAEAARFVGEYALPAGGGTLRIERAGDGLRLVAQGLAASARLEHGRWPPANEAWLRKAEDRGIHVLERLLAGDDDVVRAAFVGDRAAAAAVAALRAFAGAKVRLVGTRRQAGQDHSWFTLRGDDGERLVRVRWADQARLQEAELVDGHPFAVPLESLRPDVARALAADGTSLLLTVEGAAGARVLVFEDGTPGVAGLVDCVEQAAADARR